MTPDYVAHQAKAFLDYVRRNGLEAETAFGMWAASKALTDEARHAVWQVVHMELVARGDVALTELPEWAGDAGDELDDDSAGNAQAA